MAQRFINCYKTVLKSLCDFSNWNGNTAKWLDTCEQSDDVTVSLYSIEPIPNSLEDYFYGGDTYDIAKGCVASVLPFNLYVVELLSNYVSNLIGFESLDVAEQDAEE